MVDWGYPKTVREAVKKLISEYSLKDRVYIANLSRKEIDVLYISLASYIGQQFGLWTGNRALLQSCRLESGIPGLTADQGAGVIIQALWRELRHTHTLRAVKQGGEGNRK